MISQSKPRLMAYLVAGAFFMEMLDGTVISTALPQMAHSFGVGPVDLNIGMTAYLLTMAVFIPVSGWVADRFGTRTVFGSAIGLFTFASILCGISGSLWTFTAARILQGIGGAMMVPVGRLIVLRATEKKDIMASIATIVSPALVAPVLGPPLGGFIVTYFSWPWIFFLNVPLGLLALICTLALIPNVRGEERRPLDLIGFVLSGIACVLLIYGLNLLGQEQGSALRAGFFLAVGTAIGAAGVWHLRRHPTPLLDFSALRVNTFAVSFWGGSLFRVAVGTVPFLLPLMFQVGFGLDAFTSGLLILPVFLGNLLMKAATTPVLRRFGFRRVLLVNGVVTAFSLYACGLLLPGTPWPVTVLVLFMGGLCRSLQYTGFATIAFADVAPEEMTGANTLSSTVMQLTMGLGIAVGAVALHASAWMRSLPAGRPEVTDFHIAFFMMAGLSVLGILDSFRLAPDAGREVSGQEMTEEAEVEGSF